MRCLAWMMLLLSPSAFAGRTNPLNATELRKYQACQHTSSCIRVTNGCCDCANGGDTAAINRAFDKEFHQLFSCEKTICSQKTSACNFREPDCANGYCELGPPKVRFPKVRKAAPLPPMETR